MLISYEDSLLRDREGRPDPSGRRHRPLSLSKKQCHVSFSIQAPCPGLHHSPAADLNSGQLFWCPSWECRPVPSHLAPGDPTMAKVPGTNLPGSRGSVAPQGRGRGRGLESSLLRTRRASRRGRGRRAREAPAGWLVGPSTSAARHVSIGPRLLAQFQKAARDIAAPTETGPEPWGRSPARGAARAGAPPRRSGCGAVPPPLPGRGGRQRRRWRPGHGREEPLRSPGQPAAGRRGVPRRAAPRPARGAEPGE